MALYEETPIIYWQMVRDASRDPKTYAYLHCLYGEALFPDCDECKQHVGGAILCMKHVVRGGVCCRCTKNERPFLYDGRYCMDCYGRICDACVASGVGVPRCAVNDMYRVNRSNGLSLATVFSLSVEE